MWMTLVDAGFRTGLWVPLLKDNGIVGIIGMSRKQVQPFTDKQISLFRDFAAQATIALESTRRERQYQEALRRSEARLVEAQRLSHTGSVAYNGTAILYASEEAYRIWGFDPAQGVPSREGAFQRIHPGDREWLNAEVRRAVGEKRRYSIGYRIVLPDGTVKHLETIGQPVFSASGKLATGSSRQCRSKPLPARWH
jgi:PAS domain-containing protein